MDSNFQKCQDLSFEVWDTNLNLLSYLIQVYKRNGIKHEEYEHAKSLLSQLSKAMAKLNGKPQNQPQGNRDNNYRGGNSTLFWVLST